MGSVTPHLLLLGLAVKPVKRLLNLKNGASALRQQAPPGPEQSSLVGKAGIDGAGAGSPPPWRCPAGRPEQSLFQEFPTGAAGVQIFIDPFDLLLPWYHLSIQNTVSLTMF